MIVIMTSMVLGLITGLLIVVISKLIKIDNKVTKLYKWFSLDRNI